MARDKPPAGVPIRSADLVTPTVVAERLPLFRLAVAERDGATLYVSMDKQWAWIERPGYRSVAVALDRVLEGLLAVQALHPEPVPKGGRT